MEINLMESRKVDEVGVGITWGFKSTCHRVLETMKSIHDEKWTPARGTMARQI